MSKAVDSLILDLLEWIGPRARPYREVMEAWRTSCPRLPVWEEASERGFVVSHWEAGREMVSVTGLGAEYLRDISACGCSGVRMGTERGRGEADRGDCGA